MKNAFILVAGILMTSLFAESAPIIVGARSTPQVIVPGVNSPKEAPIVVSAKIERPSIILDRRNYDGRGLSPRDRYPHNDAQERSDRSHESRRGDRHRDDRRNANDRNGRYEGQSEYDRSSQPYDSSESANDSGGRLCKLDSSVSGSGISGTYARTQTMGYGDSDSIVDGSLVEIIGDAPIYYKNESVSRNGVAFRLLENNQSVCPYGNCSIRGQVGHIYYMYANLFKCN